MPEPFQESLAAAQARSPEPAYRKKTYVPRTPRAPEGWVMVPHLARETRTGREALTTWLAAQGHVATSHLSEGGRVGKFVSPDVAQAWRAHLASRQQEMKKAKTTKPAKKTKPRKVQATPPQPKVRTPKARRPQPPKDVPTTQLTTAEKLKRRVEQAQEEGWLTLAQAAAQVRTTGKALNLWLNAAPETLPFILDIGQAYRMVKPPVLALFRAAHTPVGASWAETAPQDWVTLLDAVRLFRKRHAWFNEHLTAGDLRAIRTDDELYYDPASITAALLAEQPAPAREEWPDGYRSISRAARDIKVKPSALSKWLEKNPAMRATCRDTTKEVLIPDPTVQAYIDASLPAGAVFAEQVPTGWLTIWKACELMGSGYTPIYKALKDGRLSAVKADGKLRFNPEDIQRLKAQMEYEAVVPEGWESVFALVEELKLDRSSIIYWMKRHGHEPRFYRAQQSQKTAFYSPEACAAYRAHRLETPGGVKIKPQMEAEIRALAADFPKGQKRRPMGSVPRLAEYFGLHVRSIRDVLGRAPSKAAQAITVDVEALRARVYGEKAAVADPLSTLPPLPPMLPAPKPEAVTLTPALERQPHAELPPSERRKPGRTAEVAARYGLSVQQVRNALKRIPINQEAV